jgi:signal transduction histidine kinase
VSVQRGRSLTVAVVDDGVGVQPLRPVGLGVASMRERATELGGECLVAGTVPHGTTVRVELPFVTTALDGAGAP